MTRLASVLRRKQDLTQAEKVGRQAVELAERSAVDRDYLCLRAYLVLMRIVLPVDPDEAVDLQGKSIAAQRRLRGDTPAAAKSLRQHALRLSQLGRSEEAEASLRDALAIMDESDNAQAVAQLQQDLADLQREQDDASQERRSKVPSENDDADAKDSE